MGEFSSQSEQKNKTVTPAPGPEEISSTGEMEYVDARASTAQLISFTLQQMEEEIELIPPNYKPRPGIMQKIHESLSYKP
jgi:hypothetical protein